MRSGEPYRNQHTPSPAPRVQRFNRITHCGFPQLPDVPALAEIDGFAGYEINTWNALLAPKGTPAGVINTLSAALNAAMKSPTLRQHFDKEGAVPAQSTPAELSAFIQDELKKWAGVVESVNIRVD
ncbi:tripartite tricarboxylate transporter substrate-binding protein [Bordetella sp. 02P26C-1]|uniref:tripartite tricarboxylate transporter substrate-binding protein n=1 Tax=Bordetella sp. 02P26C-1 TaxID=2683195 RepID=UPI0013542E24|nr:tripartite tricarboxylate transporter substrate-binding protein [Bordetella sp. 02P26C-1]MVW80311.1 hypothetical protein [Bordetella sp. 02P26C-1]